MKRILGITLGIMTALGGFVDLGQIVFTVQTGALSGYRLMWAIALGTVAIIVYMEMCGLSAVIAKDPVFRSGANGNYGQYRRAAIETALSGACNLCRFFSLEWGKNRRPRPYHL